jgi:hypothetical protein
MIQPTEQHLKAASITDDMMYNDTYNKLTPIRKVVEPTGDVCIKFTDEELVRLGIEKGDKFSIKEKDGGILLEKFGTIELDLEDFSREILELLIQRSCEEDISVNQVIENILTSYLDKYEDIGNA